MSRFAILWVVGGLIVGGFAREAAATPPFHKEFVKLYITEDTDQGFAEIVKNKKTGCFVCHQGKKRKNHNPYGEELEELLDKKKDRKKPKKIIAALKKVAKIHTDSSDENSPTYGDLIQAGKLPGGPLEEVQKEPEGEETDQQE